MKTRAAALLLLCPHLALAGGLRLAAEFPEFPYKLAQKVSAQRYARIGITWDRDEKGKPLLPHYQLFDFQERKLVDVPLPLRAVPPASLQILGSKYEFPSVNFVHYDGQITSMTSNAHKDNEVVGTYFFQYDHAAKQFSELVLLTPWDATHTPDDIGFDPTDRYFYFGTALNPFGKRLDDGYEAYEIARIDLKTRAIDWRMKLDLPKRDHPLVLSLKTFSRDGQKLALVEYNDRGIQRDHPAKPQQQAYVVDIPSKQVDVYPAPLTAYGRLFSRDNRYLILGSNQTGEMVRIDLQKKAVDLNLQGHKLVHEFLPTPSGKSFLVISNTHLSSPKAVEVRRIDDLKVQASIPMRLLYPGNDAVTGDAWAGLDGRMLMLPYVDDKGWPTDKGVRLYEVPDDVDTAEVAGSTFDLKTAQAIVLGKQYADTHGIQYSGYQQEPNATFVPFALTKTGDVIFSGFFSDNTDDDYKPGRTRPVVVRLDPTGKARWQRVLTKKGFLDYADGPVALTSDGGCIVNVRTWVHPGSAAVTRLVKLDAKGKVLWDHIFPGTGGPKTRLGDKFELLPDGSVSITGRFYDDVENKQLHAWKAVLDPKGKVVLDEISP